MPTVIETTVFAFDELVAARERAYERNLDYEWWDAVYSDFEAVCEILGIMSRTRLLKLLGGGMCREPCILFCGYWSDHLSFRTMVRLSTT